EEPEGFKETFEEFWEGLRGLGDAVMVAMAWALGYEGEEEEKMFLRCTDKGFWSARVIGYPELKDTGNGDGGISCGEHSGKFLLLFAWGWQADRVLLGADYGCTTFLLADKTPGALQVLSKSGEWVNADPI